MYCDSTLYIYKYNSVFNENVGILLQQKIVFNSFFVWSVFNPVALRKAKIAYNFGLSECNRVKKKK